MLRRRNGFYAFEGALHVFADRVATGETGLERWNSRTLWRDQYADLTNGHFFFAEDIFGGQFSLWERGVCTWDPETGESELLADDVQEWAVAIVDDYEMLTGQPLAHAWQQANGPLALGDRLLPVRPFVLGGEFDVGNLRAVEAVSGMRIRGDVARQLRALPEGANVQLKYVE